VATAMQDLSGAIPDYIMQKNRDPYSLSPMATRPTSGPRFVYQLPFTPIYGGFSPMSPAARQYVRRTWGLYASRPDLKSEAPPYSESFEYDEFVQTGGWIQGFLLSLGIFLGFSFMLLSPVRWFMQSFVLNKPGTGPNEKNFESGYLKITNVTSSAQFPAKAVKTVTKFRGEPGYFMTAFTTSETALGLLDGSGLTTLGKEGGVLTAMAALGMDLVERMQKTGRFEYSSTLVSGNAIVDESKKTR